MGKIYITRRLPDEGLDLLKDHEVEIYEGDTPPSKDEILRGIRGKDALISLLTDTIDADIMDAAPRLQIIANYAVGVDNIHIEEATRRGILVTNTPDVLTETAADLTWALILAIARRLVEGDARVVHQAIQSAQKLDGLVPQRQHFFQHSKVPPERSRPSAQSLDFP